MSDLATQLHHELRLLWRAHARAGLVGKMCLYSMEGTKPWPAKTQGLRYWFGPEETETAVQFFLTHYNNGTFPYTPLLLNPMVHQPVEGGQYRPLGSGVAWGMALTNAAIAADKAERLATVGAATGPVARGEHARSGLKILAFSQTALPPAADGTAQGCRALYDLADIAGEDYWPYYLMSGIAYISNVGAYHTPKLAEIFSSPLAGEQALQGSAAATSWGGAVHFPSTSVASAPPTPPQEGSEVWDDATIDAALAQHTTTLQTMSEAALCWEKYDRHPALYTRFGNDVAKLDENLKFFNYCARDFELFDAIGPGSVKSASKEEGGFEFLVHGLIPRGSIVLLAGTGGTGKSSLAHQLCCLAATDWRDDEDPRWIGQPLVKKNSRGICVYFSGEDGPAIINARNDLFDPQKRAHRLMFQRVNFRSNKGDEISFAQFLDRLRTMPEVPLLVVDPARKYLTGDEDDSAVVSEFFEAIERFAHEKNASVIVVHHLQKGARPQSAREVLDELRGSQVFIDRPRVVIGMFREGAKTIIGLAKCNIPPSLGMVTQERVFAHNPKTLALTQLPGPEGVRGEYIPPGDDEG